MLTTSSFFPCSIDREYLYGYAADGYRSPLWLCAAHNGSPALVHRHRGHKVFFHVGIQDRQLVAIPGIHYFDAYRLQSELLDTLDRQIDPRSMKLATSLVRDTLDIFLTHFSHFEAVNSAKGDFCKQNFLRFEQVSKFPES